VGRPVLARNSGAVNTTPFPPNISFLGQDAELEVMSKQLAESFGRVCITGMGGLGKTQLALAFVYKHQREYGKILWLDADAQSLRTCYLGLAIHLGIQTNVEEEGHGPGTAVRKEEDLVERIGDTLEKAKISCLLVSDNVDEQKEMAELLPRRGPCHIIVTTRLSAVGNFGLVHIDELGSKDGLQLLRRGLQFSTKEDQCLEQLAERFGFLTLALAVSSKLILEGRLSPSELLRRLDLKGVLVFERKLVDPTFKKHPDLVKLLQTNFDMLARDTRANEEEKRLAKAITSVGGWLARGSISTNLLARAASNLVETTVRLEGDKIEDDFERFEDSVGLLCFYASATKTTDERVVFHALVQEFGKCSGGDRAGHTMLQAVCDVGLVEQDEEHFENAAEEAIPARSGAKADLALTLEDGQRVVQAIGLKLSSDYITTRFRPEAALDLVKRCKHVLHVLEVPQDIFTCFEVFNTKALVLDALGEYTHAKHFFCDALEYLEKKVGPEQLQTATCLNHLASSLESQGKYCIAKPLYRRSLKIREKRLGHTHKSTVASITNLAGVLKCQGKYAEAEALYKCALKVHEETLGAANLETPTSLRNLACLFETEEKYDKAET
jgi:tetratricopeptide (TPR) repeat protein